MEQKDNVAERIFIQLAKEWASQFGQTSISEQSMLENRLMNAYLGACLILARDYRSSFSSEAISQTKLCISAPIFFGASEWAFSLPWRFIYDIITENKDTDLHISHAISTRLTTRNQTHYALLLKVAWLLQKRVKKEMVLDHLLLRIASGSSYAQESWALAFLLHGNEWQNFQTAASKWRPPIMKEESFVSMKPNLDLYQKHIEKFKSLSGINVSAYFSRYELDCYQLLARVTLGGECCISL